MRTDDVESLLDSWSLYMQAARKSPLTLKTYLAGVHAYLRWCERQGCEPDFSKQQVQQFMVSLMDAGRQPATVLSRQRGIKRFSAWLADEGEIEVDALARMAAPKLDDKVTGALSDDQVKALLDTCRGKEFHNVRDAAIIRLLCESMVRATELLDMTVADVDLKTGTAIVRRGKMGKGRIVPFGPTTAAALDKYLRVRRKHALASVPQLWLANRQRVMRYGALYSTLKRRGEAAGFQMHPHLLRSTGAIRFRDRGGSIASLLTIAGWSDLSMAQRYVRSAETRLAVQESHGLDLGNFG